MPCCAALCRAVLRCAVLLVLHLARQVSAALCFAMLCRCTVLCGAVLSGAVLLVLHLARQVAPMLCGAVLLYAMLCCRYTALCSTVQRSAECKHTKRRAVLRAVASPRSCAR